MYRTCVQKLLLYSSNAVVIMVIMLLLYYTNCILASFVQSYAFHTNLFVIEKNKKLNRIPMETKSNVILQRCIMLCKLNSKCHSINFGENGGHCELLNQTTKTHKDDLYDVDRWVHYETHPAKCHSRPVCVKKSPCSHGKCIDQYERPGYRCLCDPCFSGDKCQTPTCFNCNHGHCVFGDSGCACVCERFSSGKSCDRIFIAAPQIPSVLPFMNMSKSFQWSAEIRTTSRDAVIVANTWLSTPSDSTPCALWKNGNGVQGKMIFISAGVLKFEIGWIGQRGIGGPISDGKWHSIAFRYIDGSYEMTVDNVLSFDPWFRSIVPDHPDHVTVLGYDISQNLCGSSVAPQFGGEIRNIRYIPL